MSHLGFYFIHLAAFALGVSLLSTLKRRGVSWPILAGAGVLISAMMAVFVFRISEPPDLFSDFYKAYYPAAKAILAKNHADGLSASMRDGTGGFVNLPVLAWLFAPFGFLKPHPAGYVFFVFGVASTIAAWFSLSRLAGLDRNRSLLLLFLFAANGPLHNSLREGNTTHFILLLLVLGMWMLRWKRDFAAGALFGFAALIKLPLLLIGIYFVVRGRWRAAIGGGSVCALAALASLLFFGWDLHVFWFEHSIKPFAETPLAAFNVQSVQGFIARLQHGDQYLMDWTTHAVNPMVRRASSLTVALLMTATGLVILWPRRWRRGPMLEAPVSSMTELEICIVILLAMMISTVSWSHYYLWMLLPAAFLIGGKPPALGLKGIRIPGWVALIGAIPPVLDVPTKIPAILSKPYTYLAVSHYLLSAGLLFAVFLLAEWRTKPAAEPRN